MSLVTRSKLSPQGWDELAATSPYVSYSHSSAWLELEAQELGGNYSLLLMKYAGRQWLVPLITGVSWVHVGDFRVGGVGYGGPLPLQPVQDPLEELKAVYTLLGALALREKLLGRWSATLYPLEAWGRVKGLSCSYAHLVPLPSIVEEMWAGLGSGLRGKIRLAQERGVEIRCIEPNLSEIEVVWHLLNDTQHRVGTVARPTPLMLLWELCRTYDWSRTFVALVDGQIVSAMVLVWDLAGREVFHWLHGWDRDGAYGKSRANEALMWAVIQFAIERGFQVLNLGNAMGKPGLIRFKEQWGARPVPVARLKKLSLVLWGSEPLKGVSGNYEEASFRGSLRVQAESLVLGAAGSEG